MKPTSPTVWLDMTFGFLYWRSSRTPLFRRRCRMPNPAIQLALVWGCRHRSLPWGWRCTAEKIRGHSQRELFPLEPNAAAERPAYGTEFTSTCCGDGLATHLSVCFRSRWVHAAVTGKRQEGGKYDEVSTRCGACMVSICLRRHSRSVAATGLRHTRDAADVIKMFVLLLDFSLFEPCNARRHGGRTQSRRKLK